MTDRRGAQRQRTYKGARIVLNQGYSTFDCVVRNLSENGARLGIASLVGVPDNFWLAFDDGRRFSCRIIWRKPEEIGVEFLDAEGNAKKTPEP